MKNNRYRDLQLFVEVVEKGSITSAAKHLQLSKSVVSRSISQLEFSWKAQLLSRSTRNITLTEVGEIVYQHCVNVLNNLTETSDIIVAAQQRIQGAINLTSSDAFSNLVLLEHISNFMKVYPEINLNIKISGKRLDIIAEGIDLAIRIGNPVDSNLRMRKITTCYAKLYCSPEFYSRSRKKFKQLSDLHDENCITYSEMKNSNRWSLYNSFTSEKESVCIKGNVQTDNDLFLVNMAIKGLGIIFCPNLLVNDLLLNGKLVNILENYSNPVDVFALHNFDAKMPIKYRKLLDYLSDSFSQSKILEKNSEI